MESRYLIKLNESIAVARGYVKQLRDKRFKFKRDREGIQYWEGYQDALEQASRLYRGGFYRDKEDVYTVYLYLKDKPLEISSTSQLGAAEKVVEDYKQKYGGTVFYIEHSQEER